jgi:malate dehydrogenase (oxaloacetate-decarboxylating)(NADP+)
LYAGRTEGMNEYKSRFAAVTEARTLSEALVGADVFFGLSKGGAVTAEMIMPMAPNPVIFALANPDPEIGYDVAVAARPDAIMATGRSDFPNQINNVLGFPFIFRGALDVRATTINDEMKLAATRALAALAKEDVPDAVLRAYGVDRLEFGREYIIPKPFDSRVLIWEASAVAQAAMESGVAQKPVDLKQYREDLEKRLGKANEVMRGMIQKARKLPKRVVFTEGEEGKILRACQILLDDAIAIPILLGNEKRIRERIEELRLHLNGIQIVEPAKSPRLAEYVEEFYSLRQRRGITRHEAEQALLNHTTFGSVMLRLGHADRRPDHPLSRHHPAGASGDRGTP